MAKKEKTPIPDDDGGGLITALSIAAAFVASMTLAFAVGIVIQYNNPTVTTVPEPEPQQQLQAVQTPTPQTDTRPSETDVTSGGVSALDVSEPADEPLDTPPAGNDTKPQEPSEALPQASLNATAPDSTGNQSGQDNNPSVQTPNSGASTNKTDPPKSSGAAPSNPSNGTNSSNTATINPNQPQSSGAQSVGNAGTYTHDFSGGRVLGTVNSDKYHTYDCSAAKKITEENEVWYDSAEAAKASGRVLCGICGK